VLTVLGSCIHSRSMLKKKWSDARAAWNFRISRARRVNKTGDLFLRDSYLTPCKPYPKGLPCHHQYLDVLPLHSGDTAKGNALKLYTMRSEAEQWRRKHRAHFETFKYLLIYYTRNYQQNTEATVKIGYTTIKLSKEAKYLSVIFDQKLLFKLQMQQVINRGTDAAMTLASIAKSS